MARTVVLMHRLPDGSSHFDWMVERPLEQAEALVTFRLAEWGAPRFAAERLADHRRAYLDYEGPVSGGRGTVNRVMAGDARWERLDEREARVLVTWEGCGPAVRYVGTPTSVGWWEFQALTA